MGKVTAHSATNLDESISTVGGGILLLKMIDLSQTPEELGAALGILRDSIRDSWAASEEMERIRECSQSRNSFLGGFELLAAILRPKMPNIMDAACAKIILSILGVNMDKPA